MAGIKVKGAKITPKEHKNSVNTISISADGKFLATGSTDLTAKLWNLPEGELSSTFKGHKKTVSTVKISPKNKFLATGSYDGKVKLWNLESQEEIITINAYDRNVSSLAFFPDAKTLMTTGLGESLYLWEIPSGKLKKEIKGYQVVIPAITISSDFKYIATCDIKSLKILTPDTMDITQTFELPQGYSHNLAFSTNNEIIAATSDHKIQIFDIKHSELVKSIDLKPKGIYGITYSPDGKLLAMGSADKKIRIWSAS